jgi:DNA end-binding protein Ku
MAVAPRSFWKGYLKLSLVTCPVAITPATTDAEKVKFHTLNRDTKNRVESHYVDAETGKAVDEDDEVKGYESGDGEFVTLEDEELDAVALESARTIDIDTFVDQDSIDWHWYDKPHYLVPDDEVGQEAFSVIRDAMESTGKVGIARLVLYRRERAVMLEPRDKGIILWTLRYGDEVRDPDDYFGDIPNEKPDSRMMSLITQLIEERSKEWDPNMVQDPVQKDILKIINSKKKGKRSAKPAKAEATEEDKPTNVINIMEASKRSVSSEKKRKSS